MVPSVTEVFSKPIKYQSNQNQGQGVCFPAKKPNIRTFNRQPECGANLTPRMICSHISTVLRYINNVCTQCCCLIPLVSDLIGRNNQHGNDKTGNINKDTSSMNPSLLLSATTFDIELSNLCQLKMAQHIVY